MYVKGGIAVEEPERAQDDLGYHRLNFEVDATVWTVPAVFHPAHENGF